MGAPISGSARIASDGTVTQLDGRAATAEAITEDDVADAAKLTRLLARVLTDIAALRRRFVPRRLDFEDVAVLSTGATVQLQHGFGGRVRWWVAGWQCPTNVAPILREDTALTDVNTIVLRSYVAGTVTIRVEAAA